MYLFITLECEIAIQSEITADDRQNAADGDIRIIRKSENGFEELTNTEGEVDNWEAIGEDFN